MTAATCLTHVTVTEPVTGDRPEYSIRNLMLTAITESQKAPERAAVLKAECEALVKELHPNSAAAQKFQKHYAWYKSTLKTGRQSLSSR